MSDKSTNFRKNNQMGKVNKYEINRAREKFLIESLKKAQKEESCKKYPRGDR